GAKAAGEVAPDRRAQKRATAAERQRRADLRKPLQRALADIEAEMQAMESEKRELETRPPPPDAYNESNKEELVAALERQGDLTWRLARVEAQWLELQGKLEENGWNADPGMNHGRSLG